MLHSLLSQAREPQRAYGHCALAISTKGQGIGAFISKTYGLCLSVVSYSEMHKVLNKLFQEAHCQLGLKGIGRYEISKTDFQITMSNSTDSKNKAHKTASIANTCYLS